MKQAVQDFPALSASMRSENPTVVLEACKAMAKLLSFVEVLDSIERQVFAGSLVKIFELVVQNRIISELARKAQLMLHHPIQLEAVKALTYIAPGNVASRSLVDSARLTSSDRSAYSLPREDASLPPEPDVLQALAERRRRAEYLSGPARLSCRRAARTGYDKNT